MSITDLCAEIQRLTEHNPSDGQELVGAVECYLAAIPNASTEITNAMDHLGEAFTWLYREMNPIVDPRDAEDERRMWAEATQKWMFS